MLTMFPLTAVIKHNPGVHIYLWILHVNWEIAGKSRSLKSWKAALFWGLMCLCKLALLAHIFCKLLGSYIFCIQFFGREHYFVVLDIHCMFHLILLEYVCCLGSEGSNLIIVKIELNWFFWLLKDNIFHHRFLSSRLFWRLFGFTLLKI